MTDARSNQTSGAMIVANTRMIGATSMRQRLGVQQRDALGHQLADVSETNVDEQHDDAVGDLLGVLAAARRSPTSVPASGAANARRCRCR